MPLIKGAVDLEVAASIAINAAWDWVQAVKADEADSVLAGIPGRYMGLLGDTASMIFANLTAGTPCPAGSFTWPQTAGWILHRDGVWHPVNQTWIPIPESIVLPY